MTTVCAIYDQSQKQTWIGSDSLIINGYGEASNTKESSKYFTIPYGAIGVSGNLRILDLIGTQLPMFGDLIKSIENDRSIDIYQNIIPMELCAKIQELFKENGIDSTKSDSGVNLYCVGLLITYKNNIWEIGGDLSCNPIKEGDMAAIGSGANFAIGCAHGIGDTESANCKLQYSLACAVRYDSRTNGKLFFDCVYSDNEKY